MHDLIRRTLAWVRLLFSPGTGKRRRLHRHPCPRLHLTSVTPSAPPPTRLPRPRPRSPYGLVTPSTAPTPPSCAPTSPPTIGEPPSSSAAASPSCSPRTSGSTSTGT